MARASVIAAAPRRAPRPDLVSAWLFLIAALVVVMILVGGLTRLTDSGLSITEWKPVTGVVPPLSESAWEEELAKYREIPEYQRQNRGMTLEEFKAIYWWEWGHRFLGRLIGAAFLLPLLAFWGMGAIPQGFRRRLVALFLLGGLQGAVGWWMVASGLSERVDVSQYRLAAHLGVAFLLLGAIWWTALDVRDGAPTGWRGSRAGWVVLGVFALICLQIILGAFVAGLDGGRSYTGWPLVEGKLVPDAYGVLGGFWRNAFENPVAAQINHRLVGYAVLAAAILAPLAIRRAASPRVRALAWGAAALAALQAMLGVLTLVRAAPLDLSAAHQLGAVALFLTALTGLRAAGAVRSPDRSPPSPS